MTLTQVELIFKPHDCISPEVSSRLGEAGTRYIKTKVSIGAKGTSSSRSDTAQLLGTVIMTQSPYLVLS